MKIFKEMWLWVIVFSVVASGTILFFSDGINLFPESKIAIIVNAEKMTNKEFGMILKQAEQNYSQMIQAEGSDFSQDDLMEVASDMAVDQLLFISYAKKLGIQITSEEMEEFYNEVISSELEIETKAELFDTWEKEGFDKSEMEEQVKIYLLYDKIYEKYVGEVNITEEDLKEAYDDYVLWMEEVGVSEENKIMSFEEIKGELTEFITQEKALEKMEGNLEKFREESSIEILV